MNTLSLPDMDLLLEGVGENKIAQSFLRYVATRKKLKGFSVNTVARLCGCTPRMAASALKKLGLAGFGRYVPGKSGRPARIEWRRDMSVVEAAQVALAVMPQPTNPTLTMEKELLVIGEAQDFVSSMLSLPKEKVEIRLLGL